MKNTSITDKFLEIIAGPIVLSTLIYGTMGVLFVLAHLAYHHGLGYVGFLITQEPLEFFRGPLLLILMGSCVLWWGMFKDKLKSISFLKTQGE